MAFFTQERLDSLQRSLPPVSTPTFEERFEKTFDTDLFGVGVSDAHQLMEILIWQDWKSLLVPENEYRLREVLTFARIGMIHTMQKMIEAKTP